jgi:hypothetical protein
MEKFRTRQIDGDEEKRLLTYVEDIFESKSIKFFS